MQCFIKLEIFLMLEFHNQFLMPFLSGIFIMHVLHRDRMCAQSINFLYFKRKHEDLNAHSAPLFLKSKILNIPDKIKIENCLFISKYVNNKLPPIFNSWFIFSSTCHNYETSFAAKGHLKIPTVTTTTYGKAAFISMATKMWNNT